MIQMYMDLLKNRGLQTCPKSFSERCALSIQQTNHAWISIVKIYNLAPFKIDVAAPYGVKDADASHSLAVHGPSMIWLRTNDL